MSNQLSRRGFIKHAGLVIMSKELADHVQVSAVNVRAAPYNAAGDGVADDAAPIQRAIDDCYQAGGGQVSMPTGVYMLGQSLLLKNGVNLIGAGAYTTTLKLGDNVNRPVLTDEEAGSGGGSAFGTVCLAGFGIDGNRANNPSGQEGIFTTAYFSKFEDLFIRECQSHGIRMGSADMTNSSSQNRIVGCRITNCGGAGIYLDINGVDHTVSQNYIYDCDYGMLIRNGGIRVVNNDIYGNQSAGIRVEQTSNGLVIAANDLNGNRRHAIHVTRTSVADDRTWSMFLISSNIILGDKLEADNLYDGIYVQTSVMNGIAKLTIVGNKVFTLDGPHRYRYGVNLEDNVIQTKCAGNHIHDVAAGRYFVGTTCREIEIDSIGAGLLESPPVPPSGIPLTNPYHAPATVYIAGGAVTEVAMDGQAMGLTSGSFRIAAAHTIRLTYTSPPTWTWYGD